MPVGDGPGSGVPVGDGPGSGVPVGDGPGSGVPVGDGPGSGVPEGDGPGSGVPPVITFQTASSGFICTAGLTEETEGGSTLAIDSPPASNAVVPVGETYMTVAFSEVAVANVQGSSQNVVEA